MINRLSVLIFLIILFLFPLSGFARSGCCSWHGGVSYCDTNTGRYVCNDGTYSPSCGCYRKPISTPTPIKLQSPPSIPSKVKLIKNEINKVKGDYYKNPNWFRENLITKIGDKLDINFFRDSDIANYKAITYWVYTILPDIKN